MPGVKKLISVILLFLLLSPALMPLASFASGRGGVARGVACSVGGGHKCMEGGRCTMGHRQCRMHSHKKGMHGHMKEMGRDASPAPVDGNRAAFYRCGCGDTQEASLSNPLEIPCLLATNYFVVALAPSLRIMAVAEAYAGPYLAPLERPPSISQSIHG